MDEIGRGTSTDSGFSLAFTIAEALVEKGSFSLFSTHFHEITRLEDQRVRHHSMEAYVKEGENKVLHTYKLLEKPSKESYGIDILKSLDFNPKILNVANTILDLTRKAKEGKLDN